MASLHTQLLMTRDLLGWIHDVVVLEDFQKRGTATKIDNELRTIARENGVKKIRLTSNPDRIDANHFYVKRGYKRVDTNVYELTLN